MASSKQIKKWIAANKKNLAGIQSKIKKFEVALKKAVAAEKKKPAKKAPAKKKPAKKKRAVAKRKAPARKKVARKKR